MELKIKYSDLESHGKSTIYLPHFKPMYSRTRLLAGLCPDLLGSFGTPSDPSLHFVNVYESLACLITTRLKQAWKVMENRHKCSWKTHMKSPGKLWKTTFSFLCAPCFPFIKQLPSATAPCLLCFL